MRKTILRLFIISAIVLYSLLVYSWIMEGNLNRARQDAEQRECDTNYRACIDKR